MTKKTNLQPIKTGVALSLLMIAAGCTSGISALQPKSEPKAAVVQRPLATGAPEIARIAAKGGTKIAILVNNQPITTNDIKRRAAFVKLRRLKGNRRKIATDELVNEALKMQEARRIGSIASEKEVQQAYIGFAKSNKMPVKILTRIMNKQGVSQRGFKDYIKAQISWQRTVGARLQAKASGRLKPRAPSAQSWLVKNENGTTRENEYTIMQVVFLVQKKKRKAELGRRRSFAKSFRNRMKGCSNARQMAAGQKNVTVLNRGRLLESKLPLDWKKELLGMSTGSVSKVKATPRGLEVLAVCKKRDVIASVNAGANNDLFSAKKFQKAASKLDKDYLAELKKRAVIKHR
ncbi:MAG: peptidylprolyl isomerase [Rhizobiaceae bacterium]